MTSPPGGARTTRPHPGANREDAENGFISPRMLQREAAKVTASMGYSLHPARIRGLVQRFLETGRSDLIDEGRAVADFRAWFITYADPTGETAVRNVARERGHR